MILLSSELPEWKRRAISLFRSLHRESPFEQYARFKGEFLAYGWTDLADCCEVSIHLVFHYLVPLCQQAHEADDTQALQAIYGFADWCFEKDVEGDADLGNAAGVSFFEHIIDSPMVVEQLPRWLTPRSF